MTEEPAPEGRANIHHTDPFSTPPHLKTPARRLRGRLPAAVTIWTAGAGDRRTGLTMSSVVIAEGDPALLIGLVNDTTDIWEEILETETWVVHILSGHANDVADIFAGRRPSPGGLFQGLESEQSDHGPVLTRFRTRAYCRLLDTSQAGFQRCVRGTIEAVDLDELKDPLIHFRAAYRTLE